MKATELMIGDYVLVKPSMMLIKVAAIHHKKVGYHAVTHKLNWVRMDLLEPIPLTPEILEKNGFRHYEETNEYILLTDDLNCVVLTLNGLLTVIFHWNNIPIMCVH